MDPDELGVHPARVRPRPRRGIPASDAGQILNDALALRAHTSRRRGNAETAKGLPGSGLRSGDLIVANHTSYVDVLYLAFRYGGPRPDG